MATGDLAHELRPASGEAAGTLVLLHGRGTSERDLIPLLDVLDPRERLLGAFPRGPHELPPIGWHWFAEPGPARAEPESFADSYERLAAWLDELARSTGVPAARTLIGGFSQGAAMAWALALGPGRPCPAGILAMSGFLPTVPGFELSMAALDGLPVAITHGSADPVVPVEHARDAGRCARRAGAELLYRETEVPHMVDPRLVPGLVGWVDTVL